MRQMSSSLCECGCGGFTLIARQASTREGYKRGQPLRFINGHRERQPFEAFYDVDEKTGCWLWSRHVGANGYGVYSWREDGALRSEGAHRYSYRSSVGEIPQGMQLDHLCRNRACVNPSHLEPVTSSENTRRSSLMTKMTPESARWIFLSKDEVPGNVVADIYGVSQTLVSNIRTGRLWRDVNYAEGR